MNKIKHLIAAVIFLSFVASCESDTPTNASTSTPLSLTASLAPIGTVSKATATLPIASGGSITLTVDDQTREYTADASGSLIPAAGVVPVLVPMMASSTSFAACGTVCFEENNTISSMPAHATAETLSITWTGDRPSAVVSLVPASARMTVTINDLFGETNLPGFTIESEIITAPAMAAGKYLFDKSGTLLAGSPISASSSVPALVMPAEIAPGAKLFSLTGTANAGIYAGKTYTVYNTSTDPVVLTAAFHYPFTLTLTGPLETAFSIGEANNIWTMEEEKEIRLQLQRAE